MKLVKFITHYSLYYPGEVAGFPVDEAAVIVKRGAAVYVQEDPAPRGGKLKSEKAVAATDKTPEPKAA